MVSFNTFALGKSAVFSFTKKGVSLITTFSLVIGSFAFVMPTTVSAVAVIPVAPACDPSNTFDFFSLGSVNGQDGWSATGPFDQAIVSNLYGFPTFGCQSLRISNAITSGSFGDQTFSSSITDEAGESDALNGGLSGGTRQSRFEAEFDFASTQSTQQPGLFLSVSPDRGDGARMGYLGFSDDTNGIDVIFYDVQGETDPANFVATTIAEDLPRDVTHTAKFDMHFLDGPSNDVVEIYIDGVLVHTGTSWENYFRFDDESNPGLVNNNSRTVDSLLFRAGGSAAPATSGEGYLIDNITMSSGPSPLIDVTAPDMPVHLAPADGSTMTNAALTELDWTDVTDPSTPVVYFYQASFSADTNIDGSFVTPIYNSPALASSVQPTGGNGEATYYWHVRAEDDEGNSSAWTAPWSVTIDNTPPVSEIIQPTDAEVVSGTTDLEAFYADENSDGDDAVQWAVRGGTCTAGTGTVFGNVDGHNDAFSWDNENFLASIDTTTVPNGEYCFVFNPTEDSGDENQRLTREFTIYNAPVCDASQVLVSDTATFVDGHNAFAVTPHPSWATLAGSTWIWNQALDGDDSSPEGQKTFAKSFTIDGVPTGATLEVSADNGYVVHINGVQVAADSYDQNWSTIDTIAVPAEVFMTGENVITVTGDNYVRPEGYYGPNPGGVIFKLTANSDDCLTPATPEGSVQVHIYKYLEEGDSVSMIPNDSEITYQFPMRSSWNAANIGAGSGAYALGASYPGSARYSASTSAMTIPADYSTYEVTNDDEWSSSVYPISAESCPIGKWQLVGYKTGMTLAAAEASPISTTAPVFEDLAFDRHVIVVNKPCTEEVPPAPSVTIHIYKYLGDAESSAQIQDEDYVDFGYMFPMQSSWNDGTLIGSGTYVLGNDHGHPSEGMNYTASTSVMSAPADYSTSEVTSGESLVHAIEDECTANTWRLVGYKTGETLAEAQGATISSTAPSFIDISSDRHVIVVNEDCDDVLAAAQFATVAMCKVDTEENELGGWTLSLTSNAGQSILVDSSNVAGANTTALIPGLNYIATAVGEWANQNGANPADAEYSTTDTTVPTWETQMDGYTGYGEDILDLQVDGAFVDWGVYDAGHIYTYAFTQLAAAPVNFRVFDGTEGVPNEGWYADNSGNLSVTVARTFTGTTDEETGCVTFENVPFGSYTVSEVMQDGWSNVSGLGEATVDEQEETFTVVNEDNTPAPTTGTLEIVKHTTSGDGTFTFEVDETVISTSTVNGWATSTIELSPGTYDVVETSIPEGWNFESVSCVYDGYSEGVSLPPTGETIEIGAGDTVTCTFVNSQESGGGGDEEEEQTPTIQSFGGGGGNGPISGGFGGSNGSVLGASTSTVPALSCSDVLLTDYLRRGQQNDPEQVKLLQAFLNGEMSSNLPLSGVFGLATENVVKAFQLKYSADILAPWGITYPTGYVYKTTKWKINMIHCADLETPQPLVP